MFAQYYLGGKTIFTIKNLKIYYTKEMKNSEKLVLAIVFAYLFLHLLILLQVIPQNIVWGGKIESKITIYVLEGIALVTMLFIGVVIMMKNRIIKPVFTNKTIKKILLIFAVYFLLNTFGNLLAETIIEKCQAIITLYLAVIFYKSSK